MKNSIYTLLLTLLISILTGCNNDNEKDKMLSYTIKQHEILLLPDSKSINLDNANIMYPFKNETTGNIEYWISFKGYFMQGLSGIAHNVPEHIKKLEIQESGIKIRVTGEAKKGEYTNIPEILPIDFYCTSIEIITE